MEHCKAPEALGRGVVVMAGSPIPAAWQDKPRILVDELALAQPEPVLSSLYGAWASRQPVVVELGVSVQEIRRAETLEIEPYTLSPDFEFSRERIHFLTWANNYDATKGEPIWWYARLAQRLGARPHSEAEVDLDGPRWCDGGPRGSVPFTVLHRESIASNKLCLTLPVHEDSGEFDPEQRMAVVHSGCAARVLAPAGSGKTRVLTGRFRHLLQRGFEPNRVVALAYNRRAASEMVSRLELGRKSVRTLHSLGFGLLRRFRKVNLAKPHQVRQILRGLVKIVPRLNADPLAPYLEALQRVRLGLLDPEELEAEGEDIPGFARLFPRYRERLADLSLVDHDEQIYGAIELLLREPKARKLAQEACTHLLVDEFQDLTPAFLLLVRLLSAPAYQVFGVGDDDQVIYGYAGATPDYLVKFDRYFSGAQSYLLKTNYRCPVGIVAGANHLLSRNKTRVVKEAQAASTLAQRPELKLVNNEAWTVSALQQIESWLSEHEPEEIAVLSRVNALLMPLQVALQRAGIRHCKVVDESVLERTGLRTALAYWRLCTEPERWRSSDLYDALRRPNRKLRRDILEKAERCRSAIHLARYASELEPWPSSQLEEFSNDIALLSKRAAKGPAAFFRSLRLETEFSSSLEQLDSAGLGSAGSSHQDDLFALEQLAALCDSDDFEEWLTGLLRAEPNQPTGEGEGVRLSSVHRVKGLEWPCVLIYGAEEGLFPHRLSDDIEEERRIFHVALTRSQRFCVMIASAQTPSPFVAEMQAPLPPKKGKKKRKKKRR